MKLWKKLVLPVLATALLGLLVGPLASPAAALLGAAVCVVAGQVDLLPWAVGVQPPGSGATVGNSYLFNSVTAVCVGAAVGLLGLPLGGLPPGAPVGAFNASSNGGTNGVGCSNGTLPLTGTFCGTYTLLGATGILPCAGNVGGPLFPLGIPLDPWSLTSGLLILGYLDCPIMGQLVVGNFGAVALVAAPLATTFVLVVLSLPAPLPCALPPVALLGDLLHLLNLTPSLPLSPDFLGTLDGLLLLALLLNNNLLLYFPLIGFCSIVVSGVAVVADA